MTEKQTDLHRMTQDVSHGFTWGAYLTTHEVGPYQIVEFHPNKTKGVTVLQGVFENSPAFHPFVNGKDLSTTVDSLDEALILAIAYQAGHSLAAPHIGRMLCLHD